MKLSQANKYFTDHTRLLSFWISYSIYICLIWNEYYKKKVYIKNQYAIQDEKEMCVRRSLVGKYQPNATDKTKKQIVDVQCSKNIQLDQVANWH